MSQSQSYNWSTLLVAPIALTDGDRKRLIETRNWVPWIRRLANNDRYMVPNNARFFLPNSRKLFMPDNEQLESSNRWTVLTQFPNSPDVSDFPPVCIEWIDLLWREHHSLVLIKIAGRSLFSIDDVKHASRQTRRWLPAYDGDHLPGWQVGHRETPLRNWLLGDLLALPDERWDTVSDATHWFGHSLPSFDFCHLPAGWPDENSLKDLIINLGLGSVNFDPRIGPCDATRHRIESNFFQEWKNWRLYEWEGHVVFFLAGKPTSGQPANMEMYYTLLFAAVCYQHLRLTALLDLTSGTDADVEGLRRHFAAFRRRHLPHRLTTYGTGDRIYQFLRNTNRIPEIQKEIEDEIRLVDEGERLDHDRLESVATLILSVIAALFLPITVVTGIFGMNPPDQIKIDEEFFTYLIFSFVILLFITSLLLRTLTRRRFMHRLASIFFHRQ